VALRYGSDANPAVGPPLSTSHRAVPGHQWRGSYGCALATPAPKPTAASPGPADTSAVVANRVIRSLAVPSVRRRLVCVADDVEYRPRRGLPMTRTRGATVAPGM